ncbi:MAG TPA: Nudix family hydrolase [Gammaproteobacteria bacterium]
MMPPVHVMVAILRDTSGRVLITDRPPGKTQAGRWEFPGGKLERDEAPEAGLRRELLEELGVVAGPMQRLIEIHHAYPDFSVRLDVREITHFGGSPHGREGQKLKWVSPELLPQEDILEADRPIIQALRLPDFCLVTPDPTNTSRDVFLDGLQASLRGGVNLVQFRAPAVSRSDYVSLAREVLQLCRRHHARLLLNGAADLLDDVDADGIHLGSRQASRLNRRPVPLNAWLSVACHSLAELRQAQRLGADLVLISPVAATATHPQHSPIGWTGFSGLAQRANMPAFALGGMSKDDLMKAKAAGGRGIAAIRSLWCGS